MKSLFMMITICIFYIFSLKNAFAQEVERASLSSESCILSETLPIGFTPREAYLLVHDYNISLFQATFVPLKDNSWTVGGRIPKVQKSKVLNYSFVIFGNNDEVMSISPEERAIAPQSLPCLSIDKLKERLSERGAELKKTSELVKSEEKKLRRIQADVDLIADISEIVNVKEERLKLQDTLESLKRDVESMEKTFKEVRLRENPKNFLRREVELSQQIPLLAENSAQIEKAEKISRQLGESGLKKKLEAIHKAEGLDVKELEQKLLGLRKYRAELESNKNSNAAHE